jgi:galactarate dehydratase
MDATVSTSPSPPPGSNKPFYIAMHAAHNVAIVANTGGLPKGTTFECDLALIDGVPQGHTVALVGIAKDEPIRRYNITIGFAKETIALVAG